MKHTKPIFIIGALLGIGLSGPVTAQETVSATVMRYQESESGIAPYPVRIMVTAGHLRLDDGVDAGNYLLLDREDDVLYSVNHENRNILVIPDSQVSAVEGSSGFEVLVEKDPGAPRIGGREVKRVDVVADKQVCMTAYVVPGLLPDVTAALRDYQQILAARQFRDMALTPESMRGPCYYANYIHGATRHLDEGLPIQWSLDSGRQQVLMDYSENQQLDAELFTLPEGYGRMDID